MTSLIKGIAGDCEDVLVVPTHGKGVRQGCVHIAQPFVGGQQMYLGYCPSSFTFCNIFIDLSPFNFLAIQNLY